MLMLMWLVACGPEGDAANGEALYAASCVSCHGAGGDLGVETGGVAAANLQEEVPESDDAELADVIQGGEGAMAPVALDDQETADVIAYMRGLWP